MKWTWENSTLARLSFSGRAASVEFVGFRGYRAAPFHLQTDGLLIALETLNEAMTRGEAYVKDGTKP